MILVYIHISLYFLTYPTTLLSCRGATLLAALEQEYSDRAHPFLDVQVVFYLQDWLPDYLYANIRKCVYEYMSKI